MARTGWRRRRQPGRSQSEPSRPLSVRAVQAALPGIREGTLVGPVGPQGLGARLTVAPGRGPLRPLVLAGQVVRVVGAVGVVVAGCVLGGAGCRVGGVEAGHTSFWVGRGEGGAGVRVEREWVDGGSRLGGLGGLLVCVWRCLLCPHRVFALERECRRSELGLVGLLGRMMLRCTGCWERKRRRGGLPPLNRSHPPIMNENNLDFTGPEFV